MADGTQEHGSAKRSAAPLCNHRQAAAQTRLSDDSDFDHDQLQLQGQDPSPSRDHDHDHTTADGATKGTRKQKAYFREQIKGGLSLTHDMLLAPIPVPQARAAAPYSPFGSLQDGKRASFSMHTPPGSTPSSFQATVMPCSDAAEVDALIRASVRPGMSSHGSDRAFFWSLGFPKLISRKAVQDIVCKPSYLLDEDEEENGELNIVAGVIFHDL
ncbi:hypothetical protein BGW38_001800 [Lunasporangiospora selenospora]|uniref:Uncharacterized protein n=1 Tax=Lunasporangiospora selenospora TaxID=979761 RepID=A0A9P6KDU1_9FUNG|nr:hypothetical protein BGW38_001800 [Lunasporangiospora selenospora]